MKKIYLLFIDYLLITLFFLFPFLSVFRTLDKMHVDFSYLSILSLIVLVYLFITKRLESLVLNTKKKEILSFLIFLTFGFISIFYAFNLVEAIIDFSRFFLFLLVLLELYVLSKNKKIDILILFLVLFLSVESIKVFLVFVENFSFEKGLARLRELQGFSFNQNIGAFSLAIKTPILFYSLYNTRNTIFKAFQYLLIIITFFDIIIIGSRGAILALIIIILFLLGSSFYKKDYKLIKHQSILMICCLATSLFQSIIYKKSENLQIQNRITNFDDVSTKGRLNYYKACIDKIYENPIIGVGVGNWKILSLKYGSENIESYEVPYHAHNDFLHLASEIGVLGSLSYLLIFIFPVYYLTFIKRDYSYFNFIIIASIIVFLIDSNLNFPRARPYSFINIISILVVFNLYREKHKIS